MGHIKDIRILGYLVRRRRSDGRRNSRWHDNKAHGVCRRCNGQSGYEDQNEQDEFTATRQKEKTGTRNWRTRNRSKSGVIPTCMCIRQSRLRPTFQDERWHADHCGTCNFGYGTTDEKWEVDSIEKVFGKTERKLFLVHWRGHPASAESREKEHSLLEDGCAESVKEFWNRSGLNPSLAYYLDPDPELDVSQHRCWMCAWKIIKKEERRGLQMHIRLKKQQ